MFPGWLLIAVSLCYIAILFLIAWRGDRHARRHGPANRRPVIYSLALAIYFTSWTYYGAVGQAATSGWSFASIFIGPLLTFLLFWPVLAKMIRVAKRQNVTSIADFIASRYGKTQSLAAFASLVALVGTLPYIALQLKAVSAAFTVLTASTDMTRTPLFADTAFYVAAVMALFAILFGTRHTDATEHHEGLIQAIAFESIVKLSAFMALGAYVTWGVFDGMGDMLTRADDFLQLQRQLTEQDFGQSFWAQTLLAMLAIFCLPRQFHVTVVENTHSDDAARARWLFPLYLVAFGIFVLPLAAAGLTLFPDGSVEPDTFVLALPIAFDNPLLTLSTFIGGFSAATGMVIVATVAVSIMVSNEIVIPLLFRLRWFDTKARDYGRLVLRARRVTIVVILALAYVFYQLIAEFSSLASTGMLSFAAAAQFAPALLGGLYWKRGNRLGVIAGMNVGFAIWAYTLLLPALINAGVVPGGWLANGPLGIEWLAPDRLFSLNIGSPFTHGVMLSLGLNLFCYIFVSQVTPQRVVERIQASLFVDSVETRQTSINRPWTGATTVGDLKVLCERFLGAGQVERAFDDYALRNGQTLDHNTRASIDVIQFTERFLASVLGASSARIVVNSALQGRGIGISDVISIVDEASQVLEFNRALLQATIENINQGISVVDQNLRLVVWNQRYLELFRFPDHLIRVGAPFDKVLRYNALNGEYGPGDPEEHVELLMDNIRQGHPHRYVRYRQDGSVLEVQGNPMPGGGFVYTYQDITQQKRTEEALIRSENNIRIYTDNVPALIAYFDKECRYLFTNRAYEQVFKVDRNAVIGERVDNVISPAVARERMPWMHRALDGERVSFEVSLDDDGGTRYLLVTYTPHFGDSGGILGFFALYQDITERRLAEIALKETNENLEERVRERTQALSEANAALRQENRVRAEAEQALRQAKQVAEDANTSKTRFLAAASHDLLQPLNAARLFTSALSQEQLSSDHSRTLGHIDNSLQTAEELLSTLLDISKLDAGALTPRRSHFALADIFRPLRAEFEVMADERGLDLVVVPTARWIDSDAQMLRRIVQNFLSNALRYTQHGRVLLGCRHRAGRLSIQVWDTGPGIPESKQAEIFQEFRRLDQASRHKESERGLGLGLGLSIADRMSRVLDHPLKVRSWEGVGTVFSVDVPTVSAQQVARASEEPSNSRTSNKLKGARILCIDNETLILEGMKAMLTGWGCEVLTATSIGGAKSVLRHLDGDPDAILADYHLDNEVTGLMALETLLERCRGPVPGIVITADRTEEVAEEIKRGGYQLLLKPVRPAALRALLTRTLQASRATRQEH